MNPSSDVPDACPPNTDQLFSVSTCIPPDTRFASDIASISSLIPFDDQRTHIPDSPPLTFIRTREELFSLSTLLSVPRDPFLPASSLTINFSLAKRIGANLVVSKDSPPSRLTDNKLSQNSFTAPQPVVGVTSAKISRQLSEFISLSLSAHANALPLNVSHRKTLPCNLSLSLVAPKQFAPIITTSKHSEISDSASESVSGLANAWLCTMDYVVPTNLAKSTVTSEIVPSHLADTEQTSLNGPDELYSRKLRSQSMSARTATSTLGSFFSWGGNYTPALSPASTISDKSCTTPRTFGLDVHAPCRNSALSSTNTSKPPKIEADGYFRGQHFPTPPATPSSSFQIEEMERELREISSELAASIRREMELEDLVEQLQSDMRDKSNRGRRTSDYFSDSGTSSLKYNGETEHRPFDIEQIISKEEQSRAQVRLQLITTVQEERAKRKELELHIKSLEDKASHVKVSSSESICVDERVKEFENFCEELRRCLAGGRETKVDSKNLLKLKDEFQRSLDERDNLRDEVVPQLKARVEGLEAQAAAYEKLAYDQSKMHHKIQTLNGENVISINPQSQMENDQKISNPDELERELMSWTTTRSDLQPMNSRSTVSEKSEIDGKTESPESLVERLRDVELQRDSLHLALKSLLERQEYQSRENQKRISYLELELERVYASSPRLMAYNKEVQLLKEEIGALRIRADEAIRQKWNCEKSLSGLQMDLERTELEVASLRNLLSQEKETFEPIGAIATSRAAEPLEHSYIDLQKTYTESLEQIRKLEGSLQDPEILNAIKMLEQSLLSSISERDSAAQGARCLLKQNQSLIISAKSLVGEQAALANKLHESANRVEILSGQVQQQLTKNAKLRQRLAMTIARGENEQETNTLKIMSLQSKLDHLEKQLLVARKNSEQRLKAHEGDINDIKENQTNHLIRLRGGIRSPLPLSHAKLIKSSGSLLAQGSIADDADINRLRQKIIELEQALLDADKQMEEVVGRMNTAQIQVMNLQNEREEAVRETKKLKLMIESAKTNASSSSWTTMISS
ncbi:hypothetical protein K3495_g6961 [Podosphaera aphanis]|nr:hypothetical protein K3495_g6961 [Podosphaera aphanis]